MANGDLADLLAKILPTGIKVTIRHISSTPISSPALFAAAPDKEPELTICENHFLTVSIDSPKDDGAEIIIFGMEVLVYNTTHLTTVFVSKADSTGFLNLLKLPRKGSILRLVSHTFLSHLARTHQRPGVRLVVSLFARAQDQYLFPGSIDNPEKHVLDDRGLIKWWCRGIDPILREFESESVSKESNLSDQTVETAKASATAYLIVPGCDRFETRSFFPATAKSDPQDRQRWLTSYPLHQICHDPNAPPRCLVPRLPDDPKTRFLVDLDDELSRPSTGESLHPNQGQWRSVKSLDQFWEMMSFRQECSAGRLVGFVWLVINPPGLVSSTSMASQMSSSAKLALDTPVDEESKLSNDEKVPTQETTKSPDASSTEPSVELQTAVQSTDANPFSWPEVGRGQVVLSETDYKQMMDGVLDHFYDEKEIVASTKDYIDQVASLADQLTWGSHIVGRYTPENTVTQGTPIVNNLAVGLIRKRKGSDGDSANKTTNGASDIDGLLKINETKPINMLNGSLVRKKKKI
ncbi:hypothetical protein N7495_000981 [Penicillium taxi]|uniref:uncharacterized protein n=1 Tax=Penicillium taxi TaxID=168475 RepID=UPI002545127C|nr:uncharacterized protein N7495_000981 [Penicillium taxi]KAJ5908299.1 hypothetical protein N7495_000981 [Penicillium taxi]